MTSFANLHWHHSVRERLGERLVYFRVTVGRLRADLVAHQLEALAADEKINNLRAYLTFGRSDIICRAWMHPVVLTGFRFRLAAALNADAMPTEFVVEQYDAGADEQSRPIERSAYEVLDAKTIRALQAGEHPELLSLLLNKGLLVRDDSDLKRQLRFFLAIICRTDRNTRRLPELIRELARNTQSLTDVLVQVGSGFADILVEAAVDSADYLSIGHFSATLLDELQPFDVRAETHLVSGPGPLLDGNGAIDDRTFLEMRGHDPLIEAFLPELATRVSPRADEMIRFLSERREQIARLSQSDRRVVGTYARAVLDEQESAAAAALLLFFSRLEGYLRAAHPKVITSLGLDVGEIYRRSRLGERSQTLSLGDLLVVCGTAFQIADPSFVRDEWPMELTSLRNNVAHGRISLSSWREQLDVLIRDLPKARVFVDAVAEHTGLAFDLSP